MTSSLFDESTLSNVQQTVHSLFRAVTPSQQAAAINAALVAFEHSDETLHNAIIEAGAAHALSLQLGYNLHKDDCRSSRNVSDILRALSLIYQCSDVVRDRSYQATGAEVVPLVLTAIARSKQQKSHLKGDESMATITLHGIQIFRLLSVVDSARHKMVGYRSLLDIIVKVLKEDYPEQVRCETLGLLKNLSIHSEEYKVQLVRFPHLLHSLVQFCCLTRNENVREDVACIIRHLSISKVAKLHIAEHGDVINILTKLSTDENIRTKRDAISAILGLALAVENRVLLMRQSEGAISLALVRMLRSDNDVVLRRRAARALRCLACADTIELILNQHSTLEILSKVILCDPNEEVRMESAKAVSSWAMVQELPLVRCENLLKALVDAASSDVSSCVDSASAAILHQAKASDNQCFMASNESLTAVLFNIICRGSSSIAARENAVCTIFHLTASPTACNFLPRGQVLSALVNVLSSGDAERFSNDCKKSSVDAIIQLSSSDEYRRETAKHKGLMIALLKYSAACLDAGRKAAVKATIVSLVPFM